jgi:KaiC/GvpD/RAD55 family RecA-like ATPase
MSDELPYYIQKAIELGLLEHTDEGLRSSAGGAHLSALEIARIVDKLQPSSVQEREDTTPQEAIVLSRVLASSSLRARELWAALRSAFGVMQDQVVPPVLWSDPRFRAIAAEIDGVFIGQSNTQVISRDSLAVAYMMRQEASRLVPLVDFNQAIHELADPSLMEFYGDPDTEWNTALDVLKRFRVRALYLETLHVARQNLSADTKLEDSLAFIQARSTECLGLVRGTIGSQGRFVDAIDAILGQPVDGADNWIDSINKPRKPQRPISTGVYALDISCGGGIMPHGPAQHKHRLLVIAARPGIGKTALSVHVATSLVLGGATVAFISSELERESTEARLFASMIRKTIGASGVHWANAPDGMGYVDATELIYHKILPQQGLDKVMMALANEIQSSGGRLLTEAPQKPCAHGISNSIRTIKARHPELRVVVLDHFHNIMRHKGAPRDESSMLEDRANIITGTCKELGLELVLTAQMNREGLGDSKFAAKGQDPPPPNQSQIRGTDVLAHLAHCVWLCRHKPVQGGEPSEAAIEIWHSKVREGQVIWGTDASGNPTMRPVRGGSVNRSIVQIDYNTCTLKGDDTINHPAIAKTRRLLN